MSADASLETEARVFSKYILGVSAPAALEARYASAVAKLFPTPPSGSEARILRFAVARPWSLGPLDAATSLVDRESALHRRLLLMSGILETTTDFANEFIPRSSSRSALALTVLRAGFAAALKLAAGLPLYFAVRRAS